jgi:hypothetical protein
MVIISNYFLQNTLIYSGYCGLCFEVKFLARALLRYLGIFQLASVDIKAFEKQSNEEVYISIKQSKLLYLLQSGHSLVSISWLSSSVLFKPNSEGAQQFSMKGEGRGLCRTWNNVCLVAGIIPGTVAIDKDDDNSNE